MSQARISNIAKIVSGPVTAEVTYTEPEKMIVQARKLHELVENIVIKFPASVAGLEATIQLRKDQIKVNITLIFNAMQAVHFVKLGCEYVSIFIDRVEDLGLNNKQLILDTRAVIDKMQCSSKLLATSIRNPDYMKEAIVAVSDVSTMPPA